MPTHPPPSSSSNDLGADPSNTTDSVLSEIVLDEPPQERGQKRRQKRWFGKRSQSREPAKSKRPGQASAYTLLAWATLLIPLAALLWLTATFDRASWPSLVGDEAVYLMAAQSLAWDHDYRYTEADLERFKKLVGHPPNGLILQSPDGGKTMFYGKSWIYPLAIAPFVRVMPSNGYAVGNAIYLLLAACASAWALGAVLGKTAPLFVSAFIFGSITFAHVFWAHSDLLQMALVAIGCALVMQPWLVNSKPLRVSLDNTLGALGNTLPSLGNPRHDAPPMSKALLGLPRIAALATGTLLLAAVVITRPLYAPLLLIPILATVSQSKGRFGRQWRLLLLATSFVAASMAGFVAINISTTGEWSTYAGHREAFYGYTGFPKTEGSEAAVAPESQEQSSAAIHPSWTVKPGEEGNNSWTGKRLFPFPFEPHQFTWNIIYVFIGRHTGLVPYFLPFLLGVFAFRSDRVSWYLLLSVAAILGLFLFTRPFNYYGGGGALANRYFLPIYPLTWFLVRRNISWRWPVLIAALSLLTLLPTWKDPGAFWRTDEGAFTHVSKIAARYLPYETTQSTLKPAATEDITYHPPYGGTVWLKPLSPRIKTPDQGKTLTLSPGATRAEVVIATHKPQRAFRVEIRGHEPYTARFDRPSARHRMWWTFDPLYLYRLAIEPLGVPSTKTQPVTITPIAKYRPQR